MIFEIKKIKFKLENKWRRIYLHVGTTDRNRHSKKNKNKESFERWLTKKHGWATWDQELYISYNLTLNKSRWVSTKRSDRLIRPIAKHYSDSMKLLWWGFHFFTAGWSRLLATWSCWPSSVCLCWSLFFDRQTFRCRCWNLDSPFLHDQSHRCLMIWKRSMQ